MAFTQKWLTAWLFDNVLESDGKMNHWITMEGEDRDIAAVIAGLACRFPKSRNVQEFWENLIEGNDMIGPTRWPQGLYDLPPRIGAINDLDKFDSVFFNISDEEANELNPLLRHLLEVMYECVVDSALSLEELQHTKTGLYVAIFGSDTDFIETSTCPQTDHVSLSPYIAGELMSSLHLSGPCITTDTACSSSMAALNMAVQDIQSGACKYAIVAGCNLVINPLFSASGCNLVINPLFSQQMFVLNMLSKEGQSRVFDQGASGYVRAEGCAALLIASTADICQRVYANIIDIGINCDGYKESGITNPNFETQADLMRRLYKRSGIDFNDIKFVEAHGTGTQAGDKAETTGIASVFCEDRKEPLMIGSVKSNMGHSEATAALASIIKCILAMHYKEIPANLNYNTPNPEIKGIAEEKLKVVDKITPLSGKYIGVNSFGFGGVNGHVILEPYINENKDEFVQVPGNLVIPITARNLNCVEKIRDFVSNNRYNTGLLGMLSESLLSCEQKHPIRAFIQLGPKVEDFILHSVVTPEEKSQPICLCLEDFTGATISASCDLLEIDEFRRMVKECTKVIKRLDPTLDIQKCLQEGRELSPNTKEGILTAFTIIIALIQTLEEFNITMADVLGCGLTEVIAAFVDGALNLDQCLCIADCVGRYAEKIAKENGGKWKMYEVEMCSDEAYYLSCWAQVLIVHDDEHVTMAIDGQHEGKVLKKILDEGGEFKLLPTKIPFYSGSLRGLAAELKKELRDIIPAPKYRSSHMFSSHCGLNQRIRKHEQLLCDADYFSELICKPVNMFTALGNIPENSLVLKLFSSTVSMLHNEIQATDDMDQSAVNLDVSQSKDFRERSGVHRRLASASSQSFLESSINDSLSMCHHPPPELLCQSTAKSFCHTLGELHNAGHQISVHALYNPAEAPLGIDAPFLSPLVEWDHSVSWNVPRWMEFSARVKDVVEPYSLKFEELEGIHSPVSVLLYHSCKAISEKLQETKVQCSADLLPVKLYDLVLPDENDVTNEMLPDVIIQVLPGTKSFVASLEDIVVLKGSFDVTKSPHLPSIPGYDLDINENVQISPKDSEDTCMKTELQWEDDWLSFINDVYEFAIQMTETSMRELTLDPEYHLREAKDCPAFLMVFEKYTGLCRSGGCVMQFRRPVVQPDIDTGIKQLPLAKQDKTLVSKVMVYGLHSNNKMVDKIILYIGEKVVEKKEQSVLGILCLSGESKAKEIVVRAQWKTEDMEVLVPYVIASHLLYDLARVREDQTVLVLPPIDTTGVYLLSLASQLGCSVFVSTSDPENLQCLETIFPTVRVLPGEQLEENIMLLTQGQGVDVCIRVASGDIGSAMQFVGQNGHLIQCMTPADGSQLNWGMFRKGTSLSIEKPLTAFTSFTKKSNEDVLALLFDMQGEPIQKLSMEGFPEQRGILYNQENSSTFIQPISLDTLMTMITEPSLGRLSTSLMETDAVAIETLQNIVAAKPKDYSIAEMSSIRNPIQRFEDQTINRGMIMTPPCTKFYSEEQFVFSPEVNVVSLLAAPASSEKSELKLSPVSHAKTFPPTSTPLVETAVDGAPPRGEKNLEESYLDEGRELPETAAATGETIAEKKTDLDLSEIKKDRKAGKDRKVTISENLPRISISEVGKDVCDGGTPKGRPSSLKGTPPAIEITDDSDSSLYKPWSAGPNAPGTPSIKESSFMRLMNKKSKPIPAPFKLLKPKVDLLKLAPPMTPMTPALKDVLTPSKIEPNIVPLNPLSHAQGRPLFIVHPITGQTKLLEALGGELKTPCYGLQRTMTTPSDSIHNVASYYKGAIEACQGPGPYWIAGYSFGSLIAFEIAIQLQSEGKKVDKLIMLDGSPMYIQAQIAQAIQGMPTSATVEQIHDALEAGALVNWMTFFGPVKKKNIVYGILRKLPNLEERLDMAVDLTLGNMLVSESPRQTSWLAAKNKILKEKLKKSDQFFGAAKELIRLKRREKANDFVTHVQMAKAYKPFKKFEGDIYLHRVKTLPVFEAVSLATDYGLQDHCTGMVHLKFYTGDHESFIIKDALIPLKNDIHAILGIKET